MFERTVGLENYALTGVRLNAEVSCEFIQAVFFPRSPLHDGAAIIRGNQVLAAGCLLPVTDDVTYADRIGTRHRAALGLSMESDALIVVVSEETGTVSVVQDGNLRRGVEPEALRQILHNTLLPHTSAGFGRPFTRPFNRRRATDQVLLPALEGTEAAEAAAAGDGISEPQRRDSDEPAKAAEVAEGREVAEDAEAPASPPPAAARGGTR